MDAPWERNAFQSAVNASTQGWLMAVRRLTSTRTDNACEPLIWSIRYSMRWADVGPSEPWSRNTQISPLN
jgi:hypothetical protein